MAKYYTKEKERIVIRPLAFLVPIGIAFIIMLLLLTLMTLLIMLKGQIQEIEAKDLGSYILLLPLIIACIPFFTYSRRKVVFEQNDKMVYLYTLFGKKRLMSFDEMGDITMIANFGMAYYLKSKADRYGKGYRISPSFLKANDQSKREFDEVLLPAISEMKKTSTGPVVSDQKKLSLQAGVLSFYHSHNEGYVLGPQGGKWKYLPIAVVFLLFSSIGWYPLISGAGWPEKDQFFVFMPLIPLGLGIAMISRRVVFDVKRKNVRLYHFGLPLITYPISRFAGFSIVRKTHNGAYSGTDVRMKFVKEGSKEPKELTLTGFGKTNPIEPFLDETEFVLEKFR